MCHPIIGFRLSNFTLNTNTSPAPSSFCISIRCCLYFASVSLPCALVSIRAWYCFASLSSPPLSLSLTHFLRRFFGLSCTKAQKTEKCLSNPYVLSHCHLVYVDGAVAVGPRQPLKAQTVAASGTTVVPFPTGRKVAAAPAARAAKAELKLPQMAGDGVS